MEYFIQQLINGISVGSIYALIALGYTMVYGIIKLINFAHGDVFMVGSFIGLFSARYLASAGLSPILVLLISLVISMTISALLGMSIERLAYKPLRKSFANRCVDYCNWRFFFAGIQRCVCAWSSG